ncbi:hypothetical protein BH18ACI5_BH18ACI5_07240 [soil metagenome]
MVTETPAAPARRPRPWLLILLGIVVAGLVVSRMFSGNEAAPTVSTTPAPRRQAPAAQRSEDVVPADLDVRIEALKQPSPSPSEVGRNPFRFQPKPPPPPPPVVNRPQFVAPVPTEPLGPPPPPPIGNTIKFIGIVQTAKGTIGAFSDCRATFPGREGEVIEGRYRVVKIGIESAELEYLDGKGRSTLPLNGSACVGR